MLDKDEMKLGRGRDEIMGEIKKKVSEVRKRRGCNVGRMRISRKE